MGRGVYILLLFQFVFFGTSIYAQQSDSLVLVMARNSKRMYYNTGDEIFIKTKDSSYLDRIVRIATDTIQVGFCPIAYTDIKSVIDLDKRHFFKSGTIKFPIAGVGFVFITMINSLITGSRPIIIQEHLFPAAILVGMGVVSYFLKYKHYRARNWRIFTVPL